METYGWAGKILRVDLTKEKITTEPTMKYARDFLGGSGIGTKILYDEVPPEVKPFDPESKVIIAAGPLNGIGPASGRGEIVFKSPVTGWYCDSNFGGFFIVELKLAGFDAVVIEGRAKKPVYLWIEDDHAELKDASHLWGKDTFETEEIIRRDHGDPAIRTLKIGPAGENLVYGACVIGDEGRAAGRGGAGAVLGSKKFKAIAVRGTKGIKVANPEKIEKLWLELAERMKEDPLYRYWSERGTPGTVSDPYLPLFGPEYVEKIHSDRFLENVFIKTSACYACPIHCSHWYKIRTGPLAGMVGEGLEANCVLDYAIMLRTLDPQFVAEMDLFCDKMGIGIDEPALTIWGLMKMYEDGKITEKDIDGIDLTWGNKEAIRELIKKYVKREGIGDVLANGPNYVKEYFKDRGAEKYIPTTNRQTWFPGITLDAGIGFGLAISTSTRGADHLKGTPWIPESYMLMMKTKPRRVADITEEEIRKLAEERFGDPNIFDMYRTEGKPDLVIAEERVHYICDATGICKFASWYGMFAKGWQLDDFAKFLTAATGIEYTVDKLIVIADRINALQRAYNAREGKRRDELPYELRAGWKQPIDEKKFNELLDEYYEKRGFNKDGIPTRKRLEELGLKYVADDLEKRGILK